MQPVTAPSATASIAVWVQQEEMIRPMRSSRPVARLKKEITKKPTILYNLT